MKVLVIDTEGGPAIGWAMDCKKAGHDVRYYLPPFPDGTPRTAGNGLLTKVDDYHSSLKWADLIFPTCNDKLMKERDKLIEHGFPFFAAPSLGTKLEEDREFGLKLLERHGVKLLPQHSFDTIQEAQAFLKKDGGMWCIKPQGTLADKAATFIPTHEDYAAEEVDMMLEKWKKEGKQLGRIQLQKFHKGLEIGVGCYFGPGGFTQIKNTCVEFKKLMSSNFGVATGEMGTFVINEMESRVFDEMLKPIEEYLHAVNYVGDISVNCLMDEETGELFPMEFTARMGFPHWAIVQETHKEPCNWMLDLIDGKDTLKAHLKPTIGIIMCHGKFPYTKGRNQESEGVKILGLNEENMKHIQFVEVQKKGKDYYTAGEYLMVINGSGDTIHDAIVKAYDIAKYVHVPNKIVRDDVGEKLERQLPIFQKHGILLGVKYK